MLIGVKISNFALLKDVKIGIELADIAGGHIEEAHSLQAISLLIGDNNSGKSSFLQALDFLHDCVEMGITTAVKAKHRNGLTALRTIGSKTNIFLQVTFKLLKVVYEYQLQIGSDFNGKPYIVAENLQSLQRDAKVIDCFSEPMEAWNGENERDPNWPQLSLYGRLRIFGAINEVYKYIRHWQYISFLDLARQPLRNSQQMVWQDHELSKQVGRHRHLSSQGDNIINVISYLAQYYPAEFQHLQRLVASNMKLTANLKFALRVGDFANAEARLFYLFLLFCDPNPRSLLLLDMPDTGFYLENIHNLILLMRSSSLQHKNQTIFTSHTLSILDDFNPSEVWQFKLNTGEAYKIEEQERNPNNIQPESDTAKQSTWDFWQLNDDDHHIDNINLKFTEIKSLATNDLVLAMYKEGIGLSSLWYSGYFD